MAPPPPPVETAPPFPVEEDFTAPALEADSEPAEEAPAPQEELPPEPPVHRVYGDDAAYDEYDEEYSSFAHEPPFKPRRNRARMWTWAAAIFGLISFALIGAVAWYGLPDWMPLSRPLFAEAQDGLVLNFPPSKQERRTLPDGTGYFATYGTISNVGTKSRSVPTILVVLRDAHERIVYQKPVDSPKAQLAPGESVTVNQALTDVPKSAKFAEFGWKPG
jgi:hypothetical protein